MPAPPHPTVAEVTPPMQFDHIALRTENIADSVAWYVEHFPGTTVLHSDPTWGFIEAAGVKIAFVLPGHHPPHTAFRIDDAELERMAAAHKKTIKDHRDGTRSFYTSDGNGNVLEYISYPPGSKY